MTGQNDRQDRSLTGQVCDQAGHCPLTGRYFQPWRKLLLPFFHKLLMFYTRKFEILKCLRTIRILALEKVKWLLSIIIMKLILGTDS